MNILRRKVREARSAALRKEGSPRGTKGVRWLEQQVQRETSETDDQYYERVARRGKSDSKR